MELKKLKEQAKAGIPKGAGAYERPREPEVAAISEPSDCFWSDDGESLMCQLTVALIRDPEERPLRGSYTDADGNRQTRKVKLGVDPETLEPKAFALGEEFLATAYIDFSRFDEANLSLSTPQGEPSGMVRISEQLRADLTEHIQSAHEALAEDGSDEDPLE